MNALRRLGGVTRREDSDTSTSNRGHPVPVSSHRAIQPKTLQNLLHQAGVSVEELTDSFRQDSFRILPSTRHVT